MPGSAHDAGTELLELTVAMVERYVPQPGEAPDPCMDRQENLVLAGLTPSGVELWDDAWMELRGAFVLDGEPVWSVHERFGQPVIHTFADGVDDVQLTIAGFHEEDFGEPRFSKVEYCGP